MKTPRPKPTDAVDLRRHAEERLREKQSGQQAEVKGRRTADETARLVHELEVHQIELEMQNEELLQTRAKAEALLAQYTELYDYAPTGYFNLAPDGTILAVNLTGARLLATERSQLLNRRFTSQVSVADRPAFNAFLEKTFAGKELGFCEVALVSAKTVPLFVRVEAVVSEGRRECRTAVLDVTARHQVEAERELLIHELQTAMAQVKRLSGLLPMCANCKKIRNDKGYWKELESYIESHSQATFSHGICPECIQKLYPELRDRLHGTNTPGRPGGQIAPHNFRSDAMGGTAP